MAPPGSGSKPGVMIAIGIPKKGGSADGGGKMPPPGASDASASGKVSGEDAHLVLSNTHCIDCTMYHPDTGECDKVEGSLSPDDGCADYFSPINSDDEDTESAQTEASEQEPQQ